VREIIEVLKKVINEIFMVIVEQEMLTGIELLKIKYSVENW